MASNRIFLLLALVTISLLTACNQTPPKCSDKETLELVSNIIFGKDYTAEELDKNIVFEYPLATAEDKNIKKISCEAKVKIATYELPITYASQLNDKNQHIVSVGISEWNAALISTTLRSAVEKTRSPAVQKEVPTSLEKAKPEAATTPKIEESDPLISALKINKDGNGRAGEAGAATSYLVDLGIINQDPDERADYTSYYSVKKVYSFLGHKVIGFNYEYMGEYVGCCVNPGIDIRLKLNDDKSVLLNFAKQNKCEFTVDESSNSMEGNLSCHDNDVAVE